MATKKFKKRDYFQEIANRSGYSINTVEKIWEHSADFIVKQLLIHGEARVPYICSLTCTLVPECMKAVPNSVADKIRLNTDESSRIEHIPARYRIGVQVNDDLKNKFNKNMPTSLEKTKYKEELRKEKIQQEMIAREAEKERLLKEKLEDTKRARQKKLALQELKEVDPDAYKAYMVKENLSEYDLEPRKRGRPKKGVSRQRPSDIQIERTKKEKVAVQEEIVEEIIEKDDIKYDELGYELED